MPESGHNHMFDSPWIVGDHVLAWIAKVTGALAGLAGALAILWKAWKKMREVINVAGRFVQAVEALEILAVEQQKTATAVHLVCALSDQPFWRADKDGFCTFANAAYQKLVGRAMDELAGAGWSQVIHPQERNEVMDGWREACHAGRDFYIEFRIVHPSQGAINVRAKGFPVRDGRGQVVEYIGSTSRVGV